MDARDARRIRQIRKRANSADPQRYYVNMEIVDVLWLCTQYEECSLELAKLRALSSTETDDDFELAYSCLECGASMRGRRTGETIINGLSAPCYKYYCPKCDPQEER